MQERFKHGGGVPSELAIIVGRGQHVQQGGPKLKDTVQQLLQQQLHMNLDQVSNGVLIMLQQDYTGSSTQSHHMLLKPDTFFACCFS